MCCAMGKRERGREGRRCMQRGGGGGVERKGGGGRGGEREEGEGLERGGGGVRTRRGWGGSTSNPHSFPAVVHIEGHLWLMSSLRGFGFVWLRYGRTN